MMHSLHMRVFFSMMAMLAFTVAGVAFLASQTTTNEFNEYVQADDTLTQRRVGNLLAQHYAENDGWGDVRPVILNISTATGQRLTLVDLDGQVIADSVELPNYADFNVGISKIETTGDDQTVEMTSWPEAVNTPQLREEGYPLTTSFSGEFARFEVAGVDWFTFHSPFDGGETYWTLNRWRSSSVLNRIALTTLTSSPLQVPVQQTMIIALETVRRVDRSVGQRDFVLSGKTAPSIGSFDFDTRKPPEFRPITLSSEENYQVGYVRLTPGEEVQAPQESFLGSVNRSLVTIGGAAGILALGLSFALSRRILRPVEELTLAAHEMEKGHLNKRVKVASKDEIGTLGHAFNAMADGLQRLEKLRRNMVNDIAHELRSPLTTIRGYLEALQDGLLQATPEIVNSLHEEAMLLSHLIDDLQELALAESGQLTMDMEPVAPQDVVEIAISAMMPAAQEKNIRLEVETGENVSPINADRMRLGQVLRNLLKNAITHTPAEGEIRVDIESVENELEIRVCDTGSGIEPEQLQNIFERFYRTDASRARATGGAGLGLAIAKQLVLAHGGRIWAESELGQSSTFIIRLPLIANQAKDSPSSLSEQRLI
jgi:signal transduction histidine kinase